MAEIISDKKVFSLLEVTLSIQKTLSERYTSSFWVKVEMNKLNHYSYSGHCYPELVEKKDGKVIAQLKATIWKSDFQRINERFLTLLKEPIQDGIKILFCATVNFDPSYGLSLRITDIDPVFSLGELEREKQFAIEKLSSEGIFDNNKKLKLSLLPQRIAVISVETSKGYSDYLNIIEQNPWRYKFFNFLFPSLLQGEKAIPSIIGQLKRIRSVAKHFDAVAIIRGGGGDVGLSAFNNYDLARTVALFPLPVFTGIGHSTNETVIEMVAYKNAITPTELADFLIQRFHNFSVPVKKAEEIIAERANRILKDERSKFHNTIRYFQSVTRNQLLKKKNEIYGFSKALVRESKFHLKQRSTSLDLTIALTKKHVASMYYTKRQTLDILKLNMMSLVSAKLANENKLIVNLEKNVRIMDPVHILKRGFSITMHNGKVIKSHTDVAVGDTLITILPDGEIRSDVKHIKSGESHE